VHRTRILEDLGERVFDELRFEVEAERYREIPHTTWLELEALGHVEADHAIGSAGYRLTAAGWIASLRGTGKLDSQREWAVTLRTALKDVVKGRPLNGAITDFHELTARTGLPFNWIVNALQSRLLQRKRSANTVPRYKSWPRF
jgi:hypothetical protein